MRIHLKTTPNTEIVSFDYQQKLIGVLHKWLRQNDLHSKISLYSYSWLINGKAFGSKGLRFLQGASWFISFYDDTYLKTIINTILESPEMFSGMRVIDITIQENPDLTDQELFKLGSPILIKRYDAEGKEKHYTFEDSESSILLKETLVHKMQVAGLEPDNMFDIYFDQSYEKKRTKKVNIHNIGNKANVCPIIIKGKPETKLFAWLVGLGSCTGSGFGSIY
jgi:CRISPR-associated endoribonuclease Cas6